MDDNQDKLCKQELEENIDFEYFSSLFEPTRIEIVKILASHESLSVQEIADFFSQDRSVISRHLKSLLSQNIIIVKKDGRFNRYTLNPESMIHNFEKTLSYLKHENCI